MRFGNRSPIFSVALAVGAVAGVTLAAVLPGALAGAAGKTVEIGNNTAVTVPSGWTAGTAKAGKLAVTHKSPKAVLEIEVLTGVGGTVESNRTASINGFTSGFGLTKVKLSGTQSTKLPTGGPYDQAASVAFTGRYQGQTLGGAAVEYQNSTTGAGAFAVVIAKQSDQGKLNKAVSQMFESIATNP
jgi:hypothetical protein